MTVVCRMNGSNVTNFTDGKRYPEVCRQGNCVGIHDDRGILRYILPNEPSAHLVFSYRIGHWPYQAQDVVGRFEEVI